MKWAKVSIVFFAGVSACAGPGGIAPGGGLMYRVPDPASVEYVTSDTLDIYIDAGAMGIMEVEGSSSATWAMAFSEGTGEMDVTATVLDLYAEQTSPGAELVSATEEDVEGEVVFTMDRTGRGTVVSLPVVAGPVEPLVTPVSLVHDFFPRLPGEAVNPGESWTDTLSYEIEMSAGSAVMSSVTTFTLQGDTIVAGSRLLKVTFNGDGERNGKISQGGAEISQYVSGPTEGMFLWDPTRALMVFFESNFEMDGVTEVLNAPTEIPPMSVSVEGRSVIELKGG